MALFGRKSLPNKAFFMEKVGKSGLFDAISLQDRGFMTNEVGENDDSV